jgi:hypothetical protein
MTRDLEQLTDPRPAAEALDANIKLLTEAIGRSLRPATQSFERRRSGRWRPFKRSAPVSSHT